MSGLRHTMGVAQFLRGHPQGGVGQLTPPSRTTSTTSSRSVTCQGGGALLSFGIRGGYEAGVEVHRGAAVREPPRQHRGMRSRWSSIRLDHAPPALRSRPGEGGHSAGHGAAVDRPRDPRRHPLGPGPGAFARLSLQRAAAPSSRAASATAAYRHHVVDTNRRRRRCACSSPSRRRFRDAVAVGVLGPGRDAGHEDAAARLEEGRRARVVRRGRPWRSEASSGPLRRNAQRERPTRSTVFIAARGGRRTSRASPRCGP